MSGLRAKINTEGTLTKNSGIATLQGDRQSRGKETLDHQRGGSSELTVANTGRYTTNEFLEALTEGAGGLHDQRNDGRTLLRSQRLILVDFIILTRLGGAKRARGQAKFEGGR